LLAVFYISYSTLDMAVDDVQYLKENSVEDSIQVVIDSRNRDRRVYPTPSEFSVTFDVPMRNVFGVEVLDATVASSMYNVDRHNNKVRLLTVELPLNMDEAKAISVTDTVFSDIGKIPLLVRYTRTRMPRLLVVEEAAYEEAQATTTFSPEGVPETNDPELDEVSTWSSRAILVRRKGRLRAIRYHLAYVDDPAFHIVDVRDRKYAVRIVEDDAKTAMALQAALGSMAHVRVMRCGHTSGDMAPHPPQSSFEHNSSASGGDSGDGGASEVDLEVVWFEAVPTTTVSIDELAQQQTFLCDIMHKEVEITPASYDISELRSAMTNLFSTDRVDIQGQGGQEPERTFRFTYESRKLIGIDIDADITTAAQVLGFDAPEPDPKLAREMYRTIPYGDPSSAFFSTLLLGLFDPGTRRWKLTAPGVIYLDGEPYVKLRVPEIEDFLSSKAAGYGTYNTGMAMFKMSGRNMATHLRFDFYNITHRPIHPIGKLSRLTFRFERLDGKLYDFKGVNNYMLLSVKTYMPTPKLRFQGSTLNPEYDPDVMRYQLRQYVHPEDPSLVLLEEQEEDGDGERQRERERRAIGPIAADHYEDEDEDEDGDGDGGQNDRDHNESDFDYSTDGSFDEFAMDLATWR